MAARQVDKQWDAVPDVYRGDTDDVASLREADEQRARERYVGFMERRIMQEEIKACYRKEGVNHYVNCKDLAEQYMRVLARPDQAATAEDREDRARMLLKPETK